MNSCGTLNSQASGVLLEEVRELLPEMPLALGRKLALRVLREFARRAGVWRQARECLEVFCGTCSYQLPVCQGVEVVRVVDVFRTCGCRNQRLPQVATVAFGKGCCSCGWNAWHEPEAGLLVFAVPFARDETLELNVVLAPAEGGDVFPPALLDEYREAIVYGVMARACLLPGKPWADANLATYYKGLYEEAVQRAELKYRLDMKVCRPVWSDRDFCGAGGCC